MCNTMNSTIKVKIYRIFLILRTKTFVIAHHVGVQGLKTEDTLVLQVEVCLFVQLGTIIPAFSVNN